MKKNVGVIPYTIVRIAGIKIESPAIQVRSFLLLVLYIILNGAYWTEQYSEYKFNKRNRN
jgi:hypothetical protein